MDKYTRPVDELWALWEGRAKMGVYPFDFTVFEDSRRVVTGLTSYEPDAWAAAFGAAAAPYEHRAAAAETRGDAAEARANYLRAYGFYRMARFPTTNSAGKRSAYRKSQEMLLAASRFFDVPLRKVAIPFHGRAGEGEEIVAYLRVPGGGGPLPVLIVSGGIDTFKEDTLADDVLECGIATLAVDIPGTGDAPLAGSVDAERMFDAVFDWIAEHPELDAARVGYWGKSTGGYWAAKIAHTHRERLACAVSHGGCVHHAFEPDWIERAQKGDYPFELAETLAYTFGLSTLEEWVDYAPSLSLVRQGVVDEPCAPLLLVNGLHDTVFPIQDYYLLLRHGSPKHARFFDAPHMGYTRDTEQILLGWITDRLGVAQP